MANDPAIDDIRRIRHEISREAGHNLRNMKATFEMLESQFERPPVDHGGRRNIRQAELDDSAMESQSTPPTNR